MQLKVRHHMEPPPPPPAAAAADAHSVEDLQYLAKRGRKRLFVQKQKSYKIQLGIERKTLWKNSLTKLDYRVFGKDFNEYGLKRNTLPRKETVTMLFIVVWARSEVCDNGRPARPPQALRSRVQRWRQ